MHFFSHSVPICLALSLVYFLISPARAHKAHDHGRAKINIAVDGAQVTILLESPLDNILSFEYAPVTLEQREQVKEMARRMHQAESLFRLTPAAQCRLERVTLASEVLDAALLDPNIPLDLAQTGKNMAQSGKGEHSDLDAEFSFICDKSEHLNSVDILLFSVWPKMEKIAVQATTPKGQRFVNLTPKRNQVKW